MWADGVMGSLKPPSWDDILLGNWGGFLSFLVHAALDTSNDFDKNIQGCR